MEECMQNVDAVLSKREVQNAVLTGIQLDKLAEEGKLISPLQEMLARRAVWRRRGSGLLHC
jgi:hypothetical protein